MHDDRTGTAGGQKAPEAEDQAAAGQPRPADTRPGSGNERPAREPDPTRYGDWEKGGRCIDF